MTPLIPPLPPKFYPHKKILKQTFLSTEEWERWWNRLGVLPTTATFITYHPEDHPPVWVQKINGVPVYVDTAQEAQRGCINVSTPEGYWQFIGPCD